MTDMDRRQFLGAAAALWSFPVDPERFDQEPSEQDIAEKLEEIWSRLTDL